MHFRYIFTRSLLLLTISAVMLSGCGTSKAKSPRLEGERIDVLGSNVDLTADRAAQAEPILIPEAIHNEHWPQAFGDSQHALQHVALPKSVSKAWSVNIGSGSSKEARLLNAPIVSAGRVFIMNTSGEIMAIGATSGKVLWKKRIHVEEPEHLRFSGGLAVQGDYLFAVAGSGDVFALTASTGDMVWQVALATPVRGAPMFSKGRLVIVSADNRTFTLNATDGSLLWTHSGISENLALLGSGTPAGIADFVVVPYSSGEIYVLKLFDGRYMWHDSLSLNVGGDPYAGLVDVAGSPVISDEGVIYAINFNGRLNAFDIRSGQRVWSIPVSGKQTPWIVGNMLYLISDNNELIAVNRKLGSIRWVKSLDKLIADLDNKNTSGRVFFGPVFAGERLIVASNDGYALSINPNTGERMLVTQLGRDGIAVAPIVADNALYFLTHSGELIKFD